MLCPTCQSPVPATATVCTVCAAPLGQVSNASPDALAPDALAPDALAPDALAPDALAPGTRLQGGTLVLDEVLGIGGFGITYRGQDTHLHRAVAVKEFFPYGCRRDGTDVHPPAAMPESEFRSARQRFLDEAKTLAQFHHPGIVDVYTLFEENNSAYMVMEFLAGRTLLQLIEASPAGMDEMEAVGYIRQVGVALQVVHQAGMLHRDIKPENIMVCHDSRVVLIDFGTAREYMAGRTQRHSVVVTPGYAPLEQYAHRAQRGTYTDVYALAATLYHALTGRIPEAASDRAMGVQLASICLYNPQVSETVVEAVEAGLRVEVAQRPQRVEDFLRLLDRPTAALADNPPPPSLRKWKPPPTAATDRELAQYLTVLTPAEPPSVTALPPQLNRYSGRWEVRVYNYLVRWPDVCACCGAPSTTHVRLADTIGHVPGSWSIPYCTGCERHVYRARRGGELCIASLALGSIVTALGVLATDVGSFAHSLTNFETVLLWTPVALLCLSGVRQLVRAECLRSPECHALRCAVIHEFIEYGTKHIFAFQSKRFAEAFYQCNITSEPTLPQP